MLNSPGFILNLKTLSILNKPSPNLNVTHVPNLPLITWFGRTVLTNFATLNTPASLKRQRVYRSSMLTERKAPHSSASWGGLCHPITVIYVFCSCVNVPLLLNYCLLTLSLFKPFCHEPVHISNRTFRCKASSVSRIVWIIRRNLCQGECCS